MSSRGGIYAAGNDQYEILLGECTLMKDSKAQDILSFPSHRFIISKISLRTHCLHQFL